MIQDQIEEEIQTLKCEFINQDYPPKDVEMTIQNYQDGNEENKQTENRSESIVVPKVKGISEKLRMQGSYKTICECSFQERENTPFYDIQWKIQEKRWKEEECNLQNPVQGLQTQLHW